MRFLSAKAGLESLRGAEADGTGDFRPLGGYDVLIHALAAALEVRSDDPITELVWGERAGGGVRAATLGGERYEADAAVIAVPLGVLQADAVRFVPELPEEKRAALLGLRMGPIIKLVYSFDRAPLDPAVNPDIMAVYSPLNPPMWWSSSYGYETDSHIWTAFASGDWAAELLTLGEEGRWRRGWPRFGRSWAVPSWRRRPRGSSTGPTIPTPAAATRSCCPVTTGRESGWPCRPRRSTGPARRPRPSLARRRFTVRC